MSLQKWLGEGLLISSGDKWHTRRRMITPTFHFEVAWRAACRVPRGVGKGFAHVLNSHTAPGAFSLHQILQQFAVVMNEHADVLVKHLDKVADGKQVVDIFEYITRAALGASSCDTLGRAI